MLFYGDLHYPVILVDVVLLWGCLCCLDFPGLLLFFMCPTQVFFAKVLGCIHDWLGFSVTKFPC
jgi:hypothetical protein